MTRLTTGTNLIDDLEGPWDLGDSVEPMTKLLLGLFKVMGDVCEDFTTARPGRRPVNLALILFLRSDIFSHMAIAAPERDRLPVRRLSWEDPEMLMRVLDERMIEAMGREIAADDIWNALFPELVAGTPARQFIADSVLPRPRDAIFMLRECIAEAVNKGHQTVHEQDLYAARRQYSEFAFKSILVEDDPRRSDLETILVEFAVAKETMIRSDVVNILEKAGVVGRNIEVYMKLLGELDFLGVVTSEGVRYAKDEFERELLIKVARSAASNREPCEESYSVHRAFHDVLRIAI